MDKKGTSGEKKVVIFLMLVVIVGLVFAAYKQGYFTSKAAAPAGNSPQLPTNTNLNPTKATVGADCPSGSSTNYQVRYLDIGASTTTYVNNVESSAIPDANTLAMGIARKDASNTSGTTGSYSTAVTLTCKTATPTFFSGVAVTKRAFTSTNGATSAQLADNPFMVSGDGMTKTFRGKSTDQLQVRIKDKVADLYLNNTNTTTTAYGALDGDLWFTDQAGQSSLTLGTDGYIDTTIYAKSNSSSTVVGEDGLRTALCVDADTSDYQEPVVSIAGTRLTDMKATLADNDKNVLSNYEYCYPVGQFGDTERQIGFYLKAKSGVNPSKDAILRFVAEGRFTSVKQSESNGDQKIIVGAFKDDSSNTEVAYANAQQLVFNLA